MLNCNATGKATCLQVCQEAGPDECPLLGRNLEGDGGNKGTLLNTDPLPHDPAIPLLGVYPENLRFKKITCIPIAALFTTAKIGKMWYINTMEYYSAIKRMK